MTPRLHRTGSGPAMVMLHCQGMDHRMWDGLSGLADVCELISYDLPGHGESPVTGPYGIEDLSAQLHALMTQNGIERAHLMGMALGGMVAQHFAATHQAMVDRLVLCNTTPTYSDAAKKIWPEHAVIARQTGAPSLLPDLEKAFFTMAFVRRAPMPPVVQYVRDTFARCPPEGYALACELLAVANVADCAKDIKAFTLVLSGADETLAFRETSVWMTAHIPEAKMAFVPDAGHAAVLQQPQWVEKEVRAFLKIPFP